jgi:hypothetical protein
MPRQPNVKPLRVGEQSQRLGLGFFATDFSRLNGGGANTLRVPARIVRQFPRDRPRLAI